MQPSGGLPLRLAVWPPWFDPAAGTDRDGLSPTPSRKRQGYVHRMPSSSTALGGRKSNQRTMQRKGSSHTTLA